MKAVTGEGTAVTGRRCYYYSRHFIDDSQPIISSICQGGPLLLEKQETPANPYVQVRFGHLVMSRQITRSRLGLNLNGVESLTDPRGG
jgi:hypothetical protein